MKLHVREYGNGAPVVILHGLFGGGDNWHTVARAMSKRRRMIVPDQRNHGRSPHSKEFSNALLAQDLEGLLSPLRTLSK